MLRFPSLLTFVVVGLLTVAGCKQEKLTPPQNTNPAIVRVLPAQGSVTDTTLAQVNLRWVMADNERLRRFQLFELISGVRTELQNDTLEGRDVTKDFQYVISPFLSPLTQITLRAVVTDASGFQDSTDFIVTVDIKRDTSSTYPILTYLNNPQVNNNIVYNFQDDNNSAAFDLIARQPVIELGSIAAKDLADTTLPGNAFTRGFISPNNRSNSRPNAFVVLSASQFNFNRLTYQSMDQAFNANVARSFTGPLQVGDIVILKLNFQPHYAAIRITQVQDDGPGGGLDFITFDYKRSSNP